jgi:poly(beta-D-mannuronate) lyase
MMLAGPLAAAEHRVADPKEFAAAVERVAPGDTITLADGTWRDVDLVFEADGTADKPITLRAATSGKAILIGASRVSLGGSYLVVEGLSFRDGFHSGGHLVFRRDSKRLAHHCRVTECAIDGCNPPDKKTKSNWVSLYGTHNRIDHSSISGKTNAGTTLVVWLPDRDGEPNEHRIDHNYFGPRPELKKNGGETIRVGDSDTSMQISRTVVEANVFERCDGETEIISNKSCENNYRGNLFLSCSGTLTLRHGDRCTVHDNYFLGEHARGSGGVRIIGRGHRVVRNYFADLEGDEARAALSMMDGLADSPLNGYFQVEEATVADNVFVHCKETFAIGVSDDDAKNRLPPVNSTVSGNVVLGGKRPIVTEHTAGPSITWTGNICDGGSLGDGNFAAGWTKQALPPGKRYGLVWPLNTQAGPEAEPIGRDDVGAAWRRSAAH